MSMSCSTNSTVTPLRLQRRHDHVHEPELLVGRHAAGGLVQQQHARAVPATAMAMSSSLRTPSGSRPAACVR